MIINLGFQYIIFVFVLALSFNANALNFTESNSGKVTHLELQCDQADENICQAFPKKNVDKKTGKVVFLNYKKLNSFESIKLLTETLEYKVELVSNFDLLDFISSVKFNIINDQTLKNTLSPQSAKVYLSKFGAVCVERNRTVIFSNINGKNNPEFLVCGKNVYRFVDDTSNLVFEKSNLVSLLSFEEFWNADLRPFLSLTCSGENTKYCSMVCTLDDQSNCSIPMPVCRDCIGTSLLVTNIFEGMGIRYRNSGRIVELSEFFTFLQKSQFVTFSSKSVYNHVDSYDSPVLRNRFKSLCSEETEYPIVFFEINPKGSRLGKVRYLTCGNQVYEMSDDALVDGSLKMFSAPIFKLY